MELCPAGERAHRALLSPARAVVALALVVRIIPAALTYGTSDVQTWELLGRLLPRGENFYATQLHNWPPLWIYFCAAAVSVSDATGIAFPTLVKLPPIAADALITAILYRHAIRRGSEPRAAALLASAYALSPVSILITAYHGQFDSMMLGGAVLSWSLLEVGGRWVASALPLGIGIWFKPVPLVLLPVLLPRLDTWRTRTLFVAVAVLPAGLGTLPYFIRWPQDVAANFFGYSSWFGQWGYAVVWMLVEYIRGGTIPWWLPDPDYVSRPLRLLFDAGRWVLLASLGATWWWTYRRGVDTLRGILLTLTVFYCTTAGFGVQYLLWIVPFAVAARDRWLWPFTVATAGMLLIDYRIGLAYMPLAETPSNGPNMTEFIVKLASLPTWIICGLWMISLFRSTATKKVAA